LHNKSRKRFLKKIKNRGVEMKKIITIIAVLALPLICLAQQYTLENLINIGLEKSYAIQEENNNTLDASSSLRSSYYGILPSLNATYTNGKSFDASDTSWNDAATLSLSKDISLNEPTFYNIYASINNMKNAKLSLDETRKQIAYNIFNKYLSVLEAQETWEILRNNLELQKKINQQISIQYESGDKSLMDFKQSQIDLIDYEIAVHEATNSLSTARKDLFVYLGIDDKGYDFVEPELTIGIEDTVFVTNNVLQQQINSMKNSKIYLLQNAMNFLPSVSLGYSLAHTDYDEVSDFASYLRTDNALSLSISWNIFGLLDRYETYNTQKRGYKLQQRYFDYSQNNYAVSLQNSQNDFKTIRRSYDLYAEKLALSEENLNMAQDQFRLGMISLLELDDKKLDYQNTQLSHMQKHYELLKKQEEINLLNSDLILGKW